MTSTEIPAPRTPEQLAQAIHDLTEFTHDGGAGGYEASADALWKAALLAFNYTARQVGATGFQAGFAALRFYGEAMGIKGPFAIIKAEDAVYPQYDIPAKVNGWLDEWRGWIAERAAEGLAEYEADPNLTYTNDDGETMTAPRVHSRVVAHWRRLVADEVVR